MDRKAVGKKGEDEACIYLQKHGHTILERNWRGGHTEIDIVSLDESGLHFVEVKSRTAPSAADPETGMDRAKCTHMVQAARRYLRSKAGQFGDAEVLFDAITIVFDGKTTYLKYYPQVFIPLYE